MAESRTQAGSAYKPIRAPRGEALSCKGWGQEAALRMLMNSLDPAVAERPEELIASGGIGKLARDWRAFEAMVKSIEGVANDETLLIQSGAVASILKTSPEAPRVLVLNAPPSLTRFAADWMFTGPASALPETYEVFRAAARKHFGGTLAGRLVVAGGMGGMGGAQALAVTLNGGAFLGIEVDPARLKRRLKAGYCEVMVNNLDESLRILKNAVRKREPASVGLIGNAADLIPEMVSRGVLPDLLTDQTPADDLSAYIPRGLSVAEAAKIRESNPRAYREKALDSIAAHVRRLLELKKMGAVVFEFGNGLGAQALAFGAQSAEAIPDFAREYLKDDLAEGRGTLTLAALSGDADELARIDALVGALFPAGDLREWTAVARRHPAAGLPTRSYWIGAEDAIKFASAVNELVARGEIKAPVAIGRSMRLIPGGTPPSGQLTGQQELAPLLEAAAGAAWLCLHTAAPRDPAGASLSFAVLADGKPGTAERIGSVLAAGFAAAVSRVVRSRENSG